MERPLHAIKRYENEFLVLARSLLYAERGLAAHAEILAAAFDPVVPVRRVERLAGRSLAWTGLRPQPRAKVLVEKLRADRLVGALLQSHALRPPLLAGAPRMRQWPDTEVLPRVETVQELAAWLRIDVEYLLWFADLQDRNERRAAGALGQYSRRVIRKRDGSLRLLEAPKQHLKHVQRQIVREILGLVAPHEAAHGFRKGRSSVTFARPHAGREVVLRLDLKDFFPSVSGPRVQALFRTLGYPEHVADLLGGLCTVTTPRGFWRGIEGLSGEALEAARVLYTRPHLPQGSPTSPAIGNLCAMRMDRRLAGLAAACGAVYTRYADDLAFSGNEAFGRAVDRLAVRAAAIATEEGFAVQHRKTRVMRRGVRQELAGITVNVWPNLRRVDVERLEATLFNCVRDGPAGQNREGRDDFRGYLAGKVAYVAMVNPRRGDELREVFERIAWPSAG